MDASTRYLGVVIFLCKHGSGQVLVYNEAVFEQYIATPYKPVRVVATRKAITAVSFVDDMARDLPNSITESCVAQLNDYFAGERKRFALPLAPIGTTYQHKVWAGLQDIEYGETWSYAQLSQHIGQPNGSRSVGNANSKNPIAIIIPCHRVIGANGALTGYAGGLDIKSALLAHENPQRGFF